MEHSLHNMQEADCDRRASRCGRSCKPLSFEGQESDDEEALYSDQEQQSTWGHRHSSLHIETRMVCFKDDQHKSEDKELEDLIFQLHDLPV